MTEKNPEPAQLDPIAASERGSDLVEDRVDDGLDLALIQVRVLPRDAGRRYVELLGRGHRLLVGDGMIVTKVWPNERVASV